MSDAHEDSSLLETLTAFLRALPEPLPAYCLIGGLALGVWGQVRATQDIDFLMLLEDERRAILLDTLASHRFMADSRWADANPMLRGAMTRLRYRSRSVDILEPRDAHDRETLIRRQMIRQGDLNVWVASPEDLVLLKLKSGRPQDFIDALSIIVRQGRSLNVEYLHSWSTRLALQGELHYLLLKKEPPEA